LLTQSTLNCFKVSEGELKRVVKRVGVVVVHFENKGITEGGFGVQKMEKCSVFKKRRLPRPRFLIQVFPRDVGQMPR